MRAPRESMAPAHRQLSSCTVVHACACACCSGSMSCIAAHAETLSLTYSYPNDDLRGLCPVRPKANFNHAALMTMAETVYLGRKAKHREGLQAEEPRPTPAAQPSTFTQHSHVSATVTSDSVSPPVQRQLRVPRTASTSRAAPAAPDVDEKLLQFRLLKERVHALKQEFQVRTRHMHAHGCNSSLRSWLLAAAGATPTNVTPFVLQQGEASVLGGGRAAWAAAPGASSSTTTTTRPRSARQHGSTAAAAAAASGLLSVDAARLQVSCQAVLRCICCALMHALCVLAWLQVWCPRHRNPHPPVGLRRAPASHASHPVNVHHT